MLPSLKCNVKMTKVEYERRGGKSERCYLFNLILSPLYIHIPFILILKVPWMVCLHMHWLECTHSLITILSRGK